MEANSYVCRNFRRKTGRGPFWSPILNRIKVSATKILGDYSDNIKMPHGFLEQNFLKNGFSGLKQKMWISRSFVEPNLRKNEHRHRILKNWNTQDIKLQLKKAIFIIKPNFPKKDIFDLKQQKWTYCSI